MCWVYILKCIGKGLPVAEFCLVQGTEVQLWLLHSVLPAPAGQGGSSSPRWAVGHHRPDEEGPTAVRLQYLWRSAWAGPNKDDIGIQLQSLLQMKSLPIPRDT